MSGQPSGRVITFYSFKGGTGRSMALANVATELAQRNGNRVLVIDWDLEAPGLHRYFRPYLSLTGPGDRDQQIQSSPGLIELLEALRESIPRSDTKISRGDLTASAFGPIELDQYLLATDLPTLSLLKAGSFDSTYWSRINSFDWTGLFESQPEFFGAFADYLASKFTHVLIDSRTGYTDISGICTSLLPDTLVAVFTPNLQSLSGALDMVDRAVTYRMASDDLRPLRTFPLVSRVELSEFRLNESWQFGDTAQDIPGYQPRFEQMFDRLYGIENCDLTAYFDRARIAYVPYYAFGEKIAARSEESGTINLSRSFAQMTDVLLTASSAWEFRAGGQEEPKPEIPWDTQWFDSQTRPFPGPGIEARASLSRVRPSASRNQLLNALRSAVGVSGVFSEGILYSQDAVQVTKQTQQGQSVSWILRLNGDCLLFQPLPEEITVHLAVELVAKVLSSYTRIYANLGITLRADLRIDLRLHAPGGMTIEVPASRHNRLVVKKITPQPVSHVEEVVLGRMEHVLLALTKRFAAPLIAALEFAPLPDETYRQIVAQFLESIS